MPDKKEVAAPIADAQEQVSLLNGPTSPDPNVYYNGEETLNRMISKFGKEATRSWCIITAFKYLDRMGKKAGNSVEDEAVKAQWYISTAERLLTEITHESRESS